MEGIGKNENGGERKGESMVEKKRQEAFSEVCNAMDEKLSKEIGKVFEVNGREYELTCAEDCMVAYAQQMRNEIEELHKEVISRDDYYEEKAVAKLLELFKAYERLVSLYAELKSYYPVAATRAGEHIPPLEECSNHADKMWDETKNKSSEPEE